MSFYIDFQWEVAIFFTVPEIGAMYNPAHVQSILIWDVFCFETVVNLLLTRPWLKYDKYHFLS